MGGTSVAGLRVTARDRETPGHAARRRPAAREARRAPALPGLDAGEPPARVARRGRVGRPAACGRAARRQGTDRPRTERLRGAARSGRPPGTRAAGEEARAAPVPAAPPDHGYRPPATPRPP